jgi:hypothetical protein
MKDRNSPETIKTKLLEKKLLLLKGLNEDVDPLRRKKENARVCGLSKQ